MELDTVVVCAVDGGGSKQHAIGQSDISSTEGRALRRRGLSAAGGLVLQAADGNGVPAHVIVPVHTLVREAQVVVVGVRRSEHRRDPEIGDIAHSVESVVRGPGAGGNGGKTSLVIMRQVILRLTRIGFADTAP